MLFALWSILFAAILPLVWVVVAKAGAPYDNRRPRESLAAVTGYRQRANWAQQNAWEAFAPYAAAMIVAWLAGVSAIQLNVAAAVFICARILHGVMYVANLATLRSVVWLVGFGTVVYLFITAATDGWFLPR